MAEFSKLVGQYLNKAAVYAKKDGDKHIRISHLFYGILNDKKGNFVTDIIEELNIDTSILLESLAEIIKENNTYVKINDIKNSLELDFILNYAKNNIIEFEGKNEVSIEDVIYAVMFVPNELSQLFLDYAIEPVTYKETVLELNEEYQELYGEEEDYDLATSSKSTAKTTIKRNDILDNYCTNLTKLAIDNKIDDCYGRDEELNKIYRILSRTKKSNPILIGEAGVGKTNIVEGLTKNIINCIAPKHLHNKSVYSLNLNSIIAGTKYRGMFEERIQSVLEELVKSKDSILFIDEIHNIIGAGSSEGSSDLANILKPYIARNGLQIIGATTIEEYKKYFEKDKALNRRFSEVLIKEPSIDVCIEILRKLKKSYEVQHNVHYTDEAIKACVLLSQKYITYRNLPDKAIDLLDDSAAKKKISLVVNTNLSLLEKKYQELENVKREIIAKKSYDKAEDVKKQSNEILIAIRKEKIETEKNGVKSIEITELDIRNLVSEMTNIPINDGGLDIIGLKAKLYAKIIGQNQAIDILVKTLLINKLNLEDEDKPIGSFLFVGHSGVGKTQLVRELTKELFGSDKYLIRFDCSEYSQAHDISKLIGAPSGYIGYENGGTLTEEVKRNPFSVILFDEIEKAHDKLFDLLLQIMGEGRLTNNLGDVINFKNTIVILTSNIGTKKSIDVKTSIGYSKTSADDYDKSIVEREIQKRFRIEFINRIDNIVHFNTLSKENLLTLLDIEINKLISVVAKHCITLNISDKVKEYIIDTSYTPQHGFRVVKRKINDTIKVLIAEKMIQSNDLMEMSIDLVNGKIVVI